MRKFIKICTVASLALSMPTVLWAQAKLVEKVAEEKGKISIPYEKYVLPNGLIVIVHEDHSDPIVHVDVTYHVGSAREQISKSGFAHFFEHMMFQGSDNVGDEQHFKIISEAGGTLNGTTNRDRTNYFETVPSNQLEKMLWLEADRMGFLLDAVTQKKFEVQRATVKNERGQNYDNRPYGLVGEVAAKNLYPYGHPYSWLTIGYIEDLNRVNVGDLKNFFLRWYGPNNAVLTVGGDVNTAEVLMLAEQYFGSIPKGPEVQPLKLSAPVLDKDRYVSMMDNYAKVPMLRMVFPTTPQYSKDEAALDCLAEIIGQGNNSILYQGMVKNQKAVSAQTYNSTSELSGEFTVSVTPYPGQKLSDMEALVRKGFADFEQRGGATDDEIAKFKQQQEASSIYGLESVSRKVSQLAAFQTFTGNANYIGQELNRYASITKEDVMRVYQQYIKNKHCVIVSVTTKGEENNTAAADNYTVKESGYTAPNYGYGSLKYNKAKDNFDRKVMPKSGANPVVNVPKLWSAEMPNNSDIIGTQTAEMPIVNLSIQLKGGILMDANNPSKQGLASMFATMMNEDTKNYSAEAFTTELQKLGSDINVYAGLDATTISVRSLKKNLPATLKLLEERILRPEFKETTLKTKKSRTIQNIKNALNQPSYVASTIFEKLMYGDNIMGWSASGTETSVGNIELADIEQFYKSNFNFNEAKIVVVGDVNKDEVIGNLNFLNQLPKAKVSIPAIPKAPKAEATKVYFVDVPNAAQTEFRIGYVTNLKYDATGDYYRSTVVNYPLGGAFNSRVNLYLREDKGWTYGARSGFKGDEYSGSFEFSAGIRANATDSALKDVMDIISDYRIKGMTAEELSFTQNSIGQSEARKYESGGQKAAFLSRLMDYNLSPKFPEEQSKILSSMSLAETNNFIREHIPATDKMNVLLVGDKATLWDKIAALGYQMIELDKTGNPVGSLQPSK
ncbi:MAG: insulinase family protein [Chitinophagaceae bacterium]|nr:insulinase family protein [Chitinophagaceae bacterium]